jgi:hypothetical protein
MSINMIERNGSGCKYIKIFTHYVGSIGAPSRRTDRMGWCGMDWIDLAQDRDH